MKRSMNDILAEQEAAKHNSDLTNLANALLEIRRSRLRMKKFFDAYSEELDDIEIDIKNIAERIEAGEEVDVREVRAAYDARPKSRLDQFLP